MNPEIPVSYCASASPRHFFLQKKHITAIKKLRLADSVQIVRYAHASKLYVAKGDTISRGDVIAAIGSTGWSTGPHIHYEVRVNGVRKNPLDYIK